MRVSIDIIRLPVRRPPCMSHAKLRVQRAIQRLQMVLEIDNLARLFLNPERAILYESNSRGIISAILKPAESLKNNWDGVLRTNICYDATHRCFSPIVRLSKWFNR